jgi:Putative oxalocrotonate tautomerase enzyme
VRIWIDHIARTLPLPEHKADWMRRAHKAVLPIFTARGVNWELHVDETPRDLWLIQGLIPPMPNTEQEKKWHADNKPTPYAIEAAVTAQQTRPRKLAAGRGRDLQAEKLAIIDVYASICSPPWCRRDEMHQDRKAKIRS